MGSCSLCQFHFHLFEAERRVGEDVDLAVGVGDTGKIDADGKMVPLPW